MSNLITTQINKLATRFDLPQNEELYKVLKTTAFKGEVSDAQLSALLIIADQYRLNPWTKEIYAFPDKGSIVPVVGVDGWSRIINSNVNFDGIEFEESPESCTCVIYRKDRSHPIKVTEWLSECKRPGVKPWETHPKRMLRHKAMIQCARIAFGFGGIYDSEEAEQIIENNGGYAKQINPETGEITSKPATPKVLPTYSNDAFSKNLSAWQSLIESGKKTADQIIGMVSSKAVMTEEQISMIRAAEILDAVVIEEEAVIEGEQA